MARASVEFPTRATPTRSRSTTKVFFACGADQVRSQRLRFELQEPPPGTFALTSSDVGELKTDIKFGGIEDGPQPFSPLFPPSRQMHGAHPSPPSLPPPLLPPVVLRPRRPTAPPPPSKPMDRITRGAYVGRLSPSTPDSHHAGYHSTAPAPLIRIHSECFTGETVGSQRCDCGEQLDEAIRRIARAGRGAVVYLRQEGRGIGLLSKLRAYNLQDIGHDTVAANLLLGHRADERAYDIAGAILRDLGLADGVRVLTNNPDKVAALESEGLRVVERVPMVPRSWQARAVAEDGLPLTPAEEYAPAGATLIGGGAVHGEDLDKYLRTKVLKMGHMLPLWMDGALTQ